LLGEHLERRMGEQPETTADGAKWLFSLVVLGALGGAVGVVARDNKLLSTLGLSVAMTAGLMIGLTLLGVWLDADEWLAPADEAADARPGNQTLRSDHELTDVSGIDADTGAALAAAGYESVAALQRAGKGELVAVDGMSGALAARIKADVGDADRADAGVGDASTDGDAARDAEDADPGDADRDAEDADPGDADRDAEDADPGDADRDAEAADPTYPWLDHSADRWEVPCPSCGASVHNSMRSFLQHWHAASSCDGPDEGDLRGALAPSSSLPPVEIGAPVPPSAAEMDIERAAALSRARELVETGEDRRERGETRQEAGSFEAAARAFDEARDAFERAASRADEYDLGVALSTDPGEAAEAAADRKATARAGADRKRELVETVADLRERAEDAETRVDETPEAASEAFETAAAGAREARAEARDLGLDERAEALLELAERCEAGSREAAERAVTDTVTDLRERTETAEAETDTDPAAARETFETVAAEAREAREAARERGLDDPAAALGTIVERCEAGIEAAEAVAASDEGSTAHPGGESAPEATPDDRPGGPVVNEGLQQRLPEHEVLGWVGSGGNADVHRIRLADGREAALKIPRWEGTLSTEVVEAFTDEAETWAKLDRDDPRNRVVDVYDWGSQPYPWLLLEFCERSLRELIEAGDTPLEARLSVFESVLDGLEYAHGRGVVHLDIKPANVLLADDRPKIADWGLARVLLEHTRTQAGLTPGYAAPEQLTADRGRIDRQTDLYQAAVLGYELLTGHHPFDAERPLDRQHQILDGDVDPPSSVADLPSALDEVLLRGLATDREERYEACIQFRDALRRVREEL
jgi:hypothetical protein